jgi:hypothetical protein
LQEDKKQKNLEEERKKEEALKQAQLEKQAI